MIIIGSNVKFTNDEYHIDELVGGF